MKGDWNLLEATQESLREHMRIIRDLKLELQLTREQRSAAFRFIEALQDENFKLAAGQCPNVTGDEGGTPVCKEIIELRRENNALQAKIDALMLEFCPNEMTNGQLNVWAQHQKVVKIQQ